MLNYRRYGEGPPLVLQHGFLGGSGYWTPQLAAFGRHFDVVAPDLPGFAGSGRLRAPDTIEGFAVAVLRLLDELGMERAHFVGHSMGSMIALQLALDHPDRIERLVLYGSASSGDLPGRFESVETSIARIEAEGIEETALRIVPSWFVDGAGAPFAEMCKAAGKGATVAAAVTALRAVASWDVTRRLEQLRVPVLIVCGDRDRSTAPAHSYALYERIAKAQLCIVPGCAHNVHLEKPALFEAVILDFLSSSRSRAQRAGQ